MIEESFLRMYASDFVAMAARAEQGTDVGDALHKRVGECRSHAELMDRRKGEGHLAALVDRLGEESVRFSGRGLPRGDDPAPAAERHRRFLLTVAERLSVSAETGEVDTSVRSVAVRPIRA